VLAGRDELLRKFLMSGGYALLLLMRKVVMMLYALYMNFGCIFQDNPRIT
jgi:hypothetical protein